MELTVGMRFSEWKPRLEKRKEEIYERQELIRKSGKLLVGFYCFAILGIYNIFSLDIQRK